MLEAADSREPAVNIAGEFYVLAQLAHRGMLGALTLGNAKKVDILVFNELSGRHFRVEVKTSKEGPRRTGPFGYNFEWDMKTVHETIVDADLIYCFVKITAPDVRPRFWLVPARDVAAYMVREREIWFAAPHKKADLSKPLSRRFFMIPVEDKSPYEEDWQIFDR